MLAPELLEQRQDIGLNRNIEARQDFIAEEERRFGDKRTGDRDALALASRKLIGIAAGIARGEADIFKGVGNPLLHRRSIQVEEQFERPGQNSADLCPRVQGRIPILEYVLDASSQFPRARRDRSRQRLSLELDTASAWARSPLTARATVDLPLPLSPTSAKVSPALMVNEISSTTVSAGDRRNTRPAAGPGSISDRDILDLKQRHRGWRFLRIADVSLNNRRRRQLAPAPTRHGMAVADRFELLDFRRANRFGEVASRLEGATGRQFIALEQSPQYDVGRPVGVLDLGDRGDEATGIGMPRHREQSPVGRSRPFAPHT